MSRKILPSQFSKRVSFGIVKSVQNDNSMGYRQEFVEQFKLWAMPQKRTRNQQYQVFQTELQDSIVLVIRHNLKVNKQLKVQYDGKLFDILDISSDDSLNYSAYDYVTIKSVTKGGG